MFLLYNSVGKKLKFMPILNCRQQTYSCNNDSYLDDKHFAPAIFTDLQSYLCGHVLICLSFRVITVYVLCQNNLHNVKIRKMKLCSYRNCNKSFRRFFEKKYCSEQLFNDIFFSFCAHICSTIRQKSLWFRISIITLLRIHEIFFKTSFF